MHNLVTTFQERFSDWTVALGQHLQLSLLALLISIVVAVPLAVVFSSYKLLSHIRIPSKMIF